VKRLRLVVRDGREILCPRGFVLQVASPIGAVGFSTPVEVVATSELESAEVIDDDD
jgi:hypothetical protein